MRFRPGARRWMSLGIVVTVLGAASCAPVPDQARHTVAEYRAQPTLRREQLARCAADPGTLRETPDCINVREAERIEGIGSFKDLPPMGLPTKR